MNVTTEIWKEFFLTGYTGCTKFFREFATETQRREEVKKVRSLLAGRNPALPSALLFFLKLCASVSLWQT